MADGNKHETSTTAEVITSLAQIDRSDWDGAAKAVSQAYFPFTSYDFLSALEESGAVAPSAGWAAHHLVLRRNTAVLGVMPMYLKGHSRGEFVFDHAWADAYERAGGRYYPKLVGAVPFTPAVGPRLLASSNEDRQLLGAAAAQVAAERGVSSLHINFHTDDEGTLLHRAGFLSRTGSQYRFTNDGFDDWNGFLSVLASRKRKALRKERDAIAANDLTIEWLTGSDITEALLDQFWVFYQDTGARKWGTPYLTRTAFSLFAERMADQLLFIMARRGDKYIAGAMNFIGGDTLYGRYWGCTEYVPFLHFELCYYQSIDFALQHGLKHVDGGAQGEHKIARGYVPYTTRSSHWIADPGFRDAIGKYLEAEREQVDADIDYLGSFTPFKTGA